MSSPQVADGHSFARNSVLNLLGLVLPLGVAVVAIPPLVRGLGADRFGMLTLAATAIGYFGLFELGLGRAPRRGIARRWGPPKEAGLPDSAWRARAMPPVGWPVGGLWVAAATTWRGARVRTVPATLQAE